MTAPESHISLSALRMSSIDAPVLCQRPAELIFKIIRPAQQQRLSNRRLQVAVGALDPPVLMGNAAVITGRCHAVMLAQRVVSRGQIRPPLGDNPTAIWIALHLPNLNAHN